MRDNETNSRLPDEFGHYGPYGGKYTPETLMPALDELEYAFRQANSDPLFWDQFNDICRHYVGRPTPLYYAKKLSSQCNGATIVLKREDLAHTGAHKINNCLGQALLAVRMGKKRIIAETGAGQHGVATAAVCAMLGLECIIYMGEEDIHRQSLNVLRMKLLGADVRPVLSGTRTLKDAINEAIRDWVTNVRTTHYLLGSVAGPHPYPMMVRDFQSIIGKEAREQLLTEWGKLPNLIVACVGGGSNAIGIFHAFVNDKNVKFVGVEAAGLGIDKGDHAATLVAGSPGILHGAKCYLLQDINGQIKETRSIAPGLDYPGVGPEHSYYKDTERASYVAVTDEQALDGLKLLAQTEGIIPALESAHAVYHAIHLAKQFTQEVLILVNVSGRGDKDMSIVAEALRMSL